MAPSCREMFFKCCRIYREEGLPFLLYGRMMKPLAIDVPMRTIEVTSRSKVKSNVEVPAFYHSVWQVPDGRRVVSSSIPSKLRTPSACPTVAA